MLEAGVGKMKLEDTRAVWFDSKNTYQSAYFAGLWKGSGGYELPFFSARLPWWLSGEESACNAGDAGSIPESGRCPGGENGNPLQHSCLKNPMDRGAWWAVVQSVSKSQMWLSTHAHMFFSAWIFPSLPRFLHFFLLLFLSPSLPLPPLLSSSCNMMVGWHHRLRGREFEQALRDGEGQGSLACCSPWGRKETDTTERLNNSNMYYVLSCRCFSQVSLEDFEVPLTLTTQLMIILPVSLGTRWDEQIVTTAY